MPFVLIIMGVSGTGKSTIGKALSNKLSLPYFEGDEFHPAANVEKMRQGIPLDDSDRVPWLLALRKQIELQLEREESAVFASSALKASYREILQREDKRVKFVYLDGSYELILERMRGRDHEYMPPSLLKSQFETLEEPEDAIRVSIDQDVLSIVDEVISQI
ncbi:MAG: gluconokinase [Bacteroidota bacterium]